jgi:uncharacterized protein (DUF1330 family)
MAVYAYVELIVHDRTKMREYIENVPATVEAHGGKYLTRGGAVEALEGAIGPYPSKVIVEFSDIATAKAWYHCAEYQALLPNRLDNADGNFLLIEGV